MSFFIKDLFVGTLSAQFLLPIIVAIEWDFKKPVFGMFVIFSTTFVFGWLMYGVFIYFGVSDGIISGPGPRDLSMRLGLLIGFVLGCFLGNNIVKPLFYKVYFFIEKQK